MAAIGISMVRADVLEKRLKLRLPNIRPYKWGYFVGCISISFAILPLLAVALTVLIAFVRAEPVDNDFFFFLLLVLHGICGFYIIKRKRWAWVVSTVFSFNPLIWIVSGIYAGRRWQEFANESRSSLRTPTSPDIPFKPLPTSPSAAISEPSLPARGQTTLRSPIRTMTLAGLAFGLVAGSIAPFIGNLHVYRITSGYSGEQFWRAFPSEPSEDAILDAVIYSEPLITDKYEETQAWRKAQKDGTRLFIKRDDTSSICIAPYDASQEPDPAFADGSRVKGSWLTEPATRIKLPVVLTGFTYFIGAFTIFSIVAFCSLAFIRLTWYFLLRRISELSEAVRHNKTAAH